MSLHIGLYETYSGPLVFDVSAEVSGLEFSTNEHGFEACRIVTGQGAPFALAVYDDPRVLHCVITDSAMGRVWEGRVEDVRLTDSGLEITALGYWQAYFDLPYNVLWSHTDLGDWHHDKPEHYASQMGNNADQFSTSKEGRLYATLQKNTSVPSSGGMLWGLDAPHNTDVAIGGLSLTWSATLPTNWVLIARYISAAGANLGQVNIHVGTGANASGTQNYTPAAGCVRVLFLIVYVGAGQSPVYAENTGTWFVSLTDVRPRAITTSVIYAERIIEHIVGWVDAANPAQVNPSLALVEAQSIDLKEAVYEDALPGDILIGLASLGMTAARLPVEVGVYEGRILFFRPRGSAGQVWYIQAAEAELERSLSQMYNQAYGVYDNPTTNRVLRTAVASDLSSIRARGLTRRQAVKVDTADSAFAVAAAATSLTDTANPRPRANVRVTSVYDAAGVQWPLFMIRSGDTIVVRSISPALNAAADRVRSFIVNRTNYNAIDDSIEITPESPLPSLDRLLARQP